MRIDRRCQIYESVHAVPYGCAVREILEKEQKSLAVPYSALCGAINGFMVLVEVAFHYHMHDFVTPSRTGPSRGEG
jgi:uncharacterized membrane protein